MKRSLIVCLCVGILSSVIASGQVNKKKVIITGTVCDSYQSPVPGAEIMLDGSRTGVCTDKKGTYKIKIRNEAKKIGIYTLPPAVIQEPVNGRTTINFTLTDSIVKQILSSGNKYADDNVNVGYGTQKRKNLTTSVGKIDATSDRYASYTNIYDMIKNEVAGVVVDGNTIKIRAISTINGSTEPLIVIDGVPGASIDGITPQMVKSIEVLKGSAASIYGTRGSNGVLLITLKKGGPAK